MAKNKRKLSQAQKDKSNILIAKQLKQAGIISKQAKLHSGRYISKGVLKKVREYSAAAQLDYRAVKVSRDVAQAAKERGYQVVQGNRIIGPNSQTFRNRLKSGTITGVKPVKGGMMEEVTLPHSVMDMRSLIEQLQTGIDTLKLPTEQFAFKYHGAESYRAFMDSADLLQYLQTYKGFNYQVVSERPEDLQEEFEAFTIFRLHPAAIEQNIRGPRQRRLDKQRSRMEAVARGEYVGKPRKRISRLERASQMSERNAQKFLAKMAEKDRKRRERIAADPIKFAKAKEAAKERARKSRERKKKG